MITGSGIDLQCRDMIGEVGWLIVVERVGYCGIGWLNVNRENAYGKKMGIKYALIERSLEKPLGLLGERKTKPTRCPNNDDTAAGRSQKAGTMMIRLLVSLYGVPGNE